MLFGGRRVFGPMLFLLIVVSAVLWSMVCSGLERGRSRYQSLGRIFLMILVCLGRIGLGRFVVGVGGLVVLGRKGRARMGCEGGAGVGGLVVGRVLRVCVVVERVLVLRFLVF